MSILNHGAVTAVLPLPCGWLVGRHRGCQPGPRRHREPGLLGGVLVSSSPARALPGRVGAFSFCMCLACGEHFTSAVRRLIKSSRVVCPRPSLDPQGQTQLSEHLFNPSVYSVRALTDIPNWMAVTFLVRRGLCLISLCPTVRT